MSVSWSELEENGWQQSRDEHGDMFYWRGSFEWPTASVETTEQVGLVEVHGDIDAEELHRVLSYHLTHEMQKRVVAVGKRGPWSELPDVPSDGEQPHEQPGREHDDGRGLESVGEGPQDQAEDADDSGHDGDDGHLKTV